MRVLLKSGFDVYSGYGWDAVDMAVWLDRMGVDVVIIPDGITSGLPRDFTDLLTKPLTGDFDIVLQFAPPFDIHPAGKAREGFAGAGRVAVGWSMWERTPLVREDFVGHAWPRLRRRERFWSRGPRSAGSGKGKDWLDLMVVTCAANIEAFRALDDGLPYAVVPNGIDTDRFPVITRPTGQRQMTFASIGMLGGRKDPFATLAAWKRAHEIEPEFDARLILKTAARGLHPQLQDLYPNLTIINRVWEPRQVLDFYGDVDILVSTSRGEGNNKPAMEFMSTGGPVMATNWSGHQNWLHESSGYPLPGRLVARNEPPGTFDFRVDIEATAQAFIECWRRPERVRLKGGVAARQVRSSMTWEIVLDRLLRECSKVMK